MFQLYQINTFLSNPVEEDKNPLSLRGFLSFLKGVYRYLEGGGGSHALLLKAFATVHRTVVLGYERNCGAFSAGGALNGVLNPILAVTSRSFARIAGPASIGLLASLTTAWAAARRVHQTFLSVEALLSNRKYKLLATIAAR